MHIMTLLTLKWGDPTLVCVDYFDLPTYYRKRMENAIKTAEEWIAKGEGKLDDFFDLLFDRFMKMIDRSSGVGSSLFPRPLSAGCTLNLNGYGRMDTREGPYFIFNNVTLS